MKDDEMPEDLQGWEPGVLIRSAQSQDVEVISSVLTEAAEWLVSRNMPMWRANELHASRIAEDVTAGTFVVAEVDGEVAGVLRFDLIDHIFWPEMPDGDSAYLHRFAVRRSHAGGLLSGRLLDWAITHARDIGRQYVRLDCEASRHRLRERYERAGFRHHSDRQVGPYFVSRYELRILAA